MAQKKKISEDEIDQMANILQTSFKQFHDEMTIHSVGTYSVMQHNAFMASLFEHFESELHKLGAQIAEVQNTEMVRKLNGSYYVLNLFLKDMMVWAAKINDTLKTSEQSTNKLLKLSTSIMKKVNIVDEHQKGNQEIRDRLMQFFNKITPEQQSPETSSSYEDDLQKALALSLLEENEEKKE